MSGRRDDLRRSKRAEETRTTWASPSVSSSDTDTPSVSPSVSSDGKNVEHDEYKGLYDGALIPRCGYDNYRHPNHFRVWRESYTPYIKHLYTTFANAIVTPDNFEKLSKSTFQQFLFFVYRHSSGHINDFV